MTGHSDTTGLISNVIRRTLNIECAVLMGANVAPEVSIECFCEATIGVSTSLCVCVCLSVSSSLSLSFCVSVCVFVRGLECMCLCMYKSHLAMAPNGQTDTLIVYKLTITYLLFMCYLISSLGVATLVCVCVFRVQG